MTLKVYILHWKDGKVTKIAAHSAEEALNKACPTSGSISLLDYYEEEPEIEWED